MVSKTDLWCYLKIVGTANEMEDISTADDNTQEEASYNPDQDPGGPDNCNTSIEKVRAELINLSSAEPKLSTSAPEAPDDDPDDPATEGNIIPMPTG